MSPLLTERQADILRRMRDASEGSEDQELVYVRRVGGFLGSAPVARRTIFALIRLSAISGAFASGTIKRYRINETGRKLLE